ncbi:SMI1/KNR4 family protein [Listeria rocourtiae]|uniref:SMI1/KNR4 family protein n=1 Tax=Listeria rocourtiae TaxID=647910 RepID=UPI001629BB87|nr:SMI1/KNR4 family protein [Listeria rocourtiae]MBC1604417.1 SMI1/KNR4 family protein [Listeria rocourtiae]
MSIWEKESDKPPKLTNKDVELAEATFGVKLPKNYIKMLKKQNGGYLKTDAVRVEFTNDDGDGYILLDSLYGIKPDEGVMETEYYKKEWGITKGNIVIIAGNGHSFVALDYEGTTTTPKVIFIDTESSQIEFISHTFEEFIDAMYLLDIDDDEQDTIHLPSSDEIRELALSADIAEVSKGVYLWICDYSMPKDEALLFTAMERVYAEGSEHQKVEIASAARMEIENEGIIDQKFIHLILSLLQKEDDLDLVMYKEMIEEFLSTEG